MNPMDYVNIGALAFSVTATIAAVVAAWWGWLDRPQVAFRFNTTRDRTRTVDRSARPGESVTDLLVVDHQSDGFGATVKVFCEGDGVVRDVYFRPSGSIKLIPGEREDVLRSRMTADSAPLEINLRVPSLERQKADPYLEIVWTTLRPRRHHGQRIHLRTRALETWQWSLWRWGWRKRPHEPWWKHRLVRTQGRWVVDRKNPLVTVPADPRHFPESQR